METERNIKPGIESTGPVRSISEKIGRLGSATSKGLQTSRDRAVYYIPGIFLVSMGFSLLFAPSVFVALSSALLLYLGVLSIIFGRRAMVAAQKFKEVVRQIEARIYIRGQAPKSESSENTGGRSNDWSSAGADPAAGPDKKTVFH